jgi:hypothetical protein
MQKSFILFVLSGLILFSLNSNAQSALTMADQFAAEAGAIAGTAQACGQNIVEYNARVVAAVNALSQSPSDSSQAMTIYQKTLSNAQDAQSRTHSVNCGEMIQKFNGLPIMRPDYKTTVIPKLAAMVNPPEASTTAPKTSSTTQTSPMTTPPTSQTTSITTGN